MTEERAAAPLEDADVQGEDGTLACPGCNSSVGRDGKPWESAQAVKMHYNMWCPSNPDRGRDKQAGVDQITGRIKRRSRRGQAARTSSEGVPSAFDQIPRARNQTAPILTGSSAYYFRSDGATIAEGLTRYPGGAGAGRQGRNAAYYRQRQEARGNIYLGQNLTRAAIQKMIDIMDENREDYILFLGEELEECNADLDSGNLTIENRQKQLRRREQLQRQLAIANQPWDPDALAKELDEIGQAQRLARTMTPGQLQAVREMIRDIVGEEVASQNNSLAAAMSASLPSEGRGPDKDDEAGRDNIEADEIVAGMAR